MQTLTNGALGTRANSKPSKRLRMRETHTGISITEDSGGWTDRAELMEIVFKLVGVLLLPAGGIVMFLPNMLAGHTSLIVPVSMLSAFVFLGVSIHRWANKGFKPKLHVNPTRREVVIGTQNMEGQFHKRRAFSADAIESFFIARSKDRKTPAKLKMRLATGGQSLAVLEGPEKSLIPILERISQLMQPPAKRNQRIRTKANGDFIRVDFG